MAGWTSTGTTVDTSKIASSSILFAKNGSETIRQAETVETSEIRGLTKTAAKNMAGVTDNSVQTVYYAHIGDDDHAITVLSGTKIEKSAQRANEADGWTVTVKTTTYSTLPATLPTCWKDNRADAGVSTMNELVSRDRSSSYIWDRSDGNTPNALFATKTTSVYESTGLTKEEADNIVNGTASENTHTVARIAWEVYNGTAGDGLGVGWYAWAWASCQVGSDVFASARKVSDEEGWTVTKTVVEHGWSQTNQTITQRWRRVT